MTTAHPHPRARTLRYGMVGGGQGAFIGPVHRMAIALDGRATLAAGALSGNAAAARASASALGLPAERGYADWRAMLAAERARRDDRLDFVVVVTPNHTHAEIAEGFLEAGFALVLDKPMVTTSAEAQRLREAERRGGAFLAVTYNYSGYPMVRAAADVVRSGGLGAVRKVIAEYHQGWLSTALDAQGHKQAEWRTDPARAGAAGCLGDIGTHAAQLVRVVTGLEIESLSADLAALVPGRRLDDDASVLLRFKEAHGVRARGVLTASQIAYGEENNLTLRVYGERGALAWRQEEPNTLVRTRADGVRETLTRGSAGLGEAAAQAVRIPPGHPEGFIEAFANVYAGVCDRLLGVASTRAERVPGWADGAEGVRFIEAAVKSAAVGGGWVSVDDKVR